MRKSGLKNLNIKRCFEVYKYYKTDLTTAFHTPK